MQLDSNTRIKNQKDKMKSVLLFLAQGFEELEASAFTDVFGWNRIYGDPDVRLITTGLRNEIKCTWNLTVKPELDFSGINASHFNALAIPGGFEETGFYEDAFDERFLQLIRDFDNQKKFIASVCTGAMPVGKSGALNGRTATTYDLGGIRRPQLAGYGAIVLDRRIVIDQNIITSTGPSTSLDVAFILLEMLTSPGNVSKVREHMRFT
jgi:4-methyl-5(b-hydroxyethyl)-thiazole monophosphate biosynthesis